MKKLLVLVFATAVATCALAVDHFWQGDVNDLWSEGNNWTDDVYSGADLGVPTASDAVTILNPGYSAATRVAGGGAIAKEITLGKWTHPGLLTVDAAGGLTVVDNLLVGNVAEPNVVAIMSNAGQIDVGLGVYMREQATFSNAGTLNASDIILGDGTNTISQFSNTGNITLTNWMYLSVTASNTPSVFNMDGGTLTAKHMEMADSGRGKLNLNGGVINLETFGLNGNGGYTIDVEGGVLIAGGNQTNGINWMAGVGLITAYDGFPGTVVVSEYNAGTDQTTLSATGAPQATNVLDYLWQGDIDNLWTNGANWTDSGYSGADLGVPDAESIVTILNPGGIPPVTLDAAGVAWTVNLGKWGNPGNLAIETNGTLDIWNHLILGHLEQTTNSVVNAGEINARQSVNMRGTIAYLENSGTIATRDFLLGDEAGVASTFINTGDVTVDGWMYLSVTASNTPSVFNMNGGTVDIGVQFEMIPGGAGRLNLNGGTITCGSIGLVDDDAYIIDVGGGVLIVDGDFTGAMNYLIATGRIIAYDNYPGAVVTAVYDSGSNKTTLSATGGPLANYDEWDALWTEDLSDRMADYEGDGLINLFEYAFGGDPLVDDAATVGPSMDVVGDEMTHIYRRRIQAYNSGELTYTGEVTTDLVIGPWYPISALGAETVGATADPNIAAVTNVVDVTGIDAGFVKTTVTEN